MKDVSITQLTIDSERNLLLPCSDTRDHGAANVFPSILLSHGLQCQEVFVAENLRQKKSEMIECSSSKGTFAFENRDKAVLWGERKAPFNTLKGTSPQLLKSNLGSELGGVKGVSFGL